MSEYIYAGLTSQSIDIFIQDASSTVGAGLSGLVYNSGSLVASYRKGATGSRTAITLATQTVGGAYSSGGFVEIEATHMKGTYRLDLPNAAVDTEGFITVYLYGAANMVPVVLRIDCKALPVNVLQISATVAAKIADIILRRTQSNVEGSSDGDTLSLGSLYGLIQQAQESNTVDSPGNLTVYQTDGTTSLGTKALDTDAGADPIVGLS